MKKVKADEIEKAIEELLEDYGVSVTKSLNEALKETADETRKEIEGKSLSEFGGTGEYARSWDVMKSPNRKKLSVGFLVYARAPYYRIAHLLEKPHLMRNGQRWTGNKPIIEDAENNAEKKIIDKVRRKMGS